MKVGVISDVHANYPALASILSASNNDRIEKWLVLGDLVGYYYWASECIEALQRLNIECIGGNHDRMVVLAYRDRSKLEILRELYGSGHKVAVEQLNRVQIDWLDSLPDTSNICISGHRIHLCHGSPWDPIEYIYPDAPNETWKRFGQANFDVVLYGHSHYANVRFVGDTLVLNPGSVGQPRDRKGGAQWAIWDSETNTFELRRESYDISLVQELCRTHDTDQSYLCDVLGVCVN
jgi:putative phosphoesterase